MRGGAAVDFGSTPADTIYFIEPTVIEVATPAGTGTVDVTVVTLNSGTTPTSIADLYTFTGTLGVSAVGPFFGSAAGGTSVTITGSNFTGVSGVSFGGVAATSYTVDSPTTITAVDPAGTGTVDVTVTTSAGTSPTSSGDQFTYVTSPTTTTLTDNGPNPSLSGASVSFTVSVSSASPISGETVSIEDGSTVIATPTLTNGTATFTLSSLRLWAITTWRRSIRRMGPTPPAIRAW